MPVLSCLSAASNAVAAPSKGKPESKNNDIEEEDGALEEKVETVEQDGCPDEEDFNRYCRIITTYG